MSHYPNASEGLKLLFYAQILIIVGTLLSLVPIVGSLIVLAGGILDLVGLNRAGQDDEGYRTAFTLVIVSIVVDVLSGFAGSKGFLFLATPLSIASILVSLGIIYFVCITTSNLLHSVGEEALSQRGITVWKINLLCTALSVVLVLLMVIPVLNILAAIGEIAVTIAEIVGYVLYMMFLSGSYKAL